MKSIQIFLLLFFSALTLLSSQTLGVRVNDIPIKNVDLNNLEFESNDKIMFLFKSLDDIEGKFGFNVLLNGQEQEPSFINETRGYITLINLDPGKYLFKVIVNKDGESFGKPLVAKFNVSESEIVDKPINKEVISDSNMLVTILISVAIIQFCIIVFFIIKLKQKPAVKENSQETIKKENDNYEDELNELKTAYSMLKDNFTKCKGEKEFYKKQIKALNKTVSELENANVELLSQKDTLYSKKHELELLQKQKDDLFATAIHDIKNPASAMKGLFELLESYDLTATEQQEIMQTLIDSSHNIMELTQKLTDMMREEKPEDIVILEEASLKEIVDSVVNVNQAYANKKKIKILNRTSYSLPEIELDRLKIKEVLDNLINNAIKYGPEGTIVEIRGFFSDKKITIEVNDTGVGLSEHDTSLVFSKGITLSPKPTGGEHSSGLGLWIAKKYVEDHNGKIWVRSKIGAGSTFGFELPRK